jgi:hypothetical protein
MISKRMIVFQASAARVANFERSRALIPDLVFVPAVDAIHNYERHRADALQRSLVTHDYVRSNERLPGKLGCNLSHLSVLRAVAEAEEPWALVLEDDLVLGGYSESEMTAIAREATQAKAHYVQLYTNPRFWAAQTTSPSLTASLVSMIPQWHTCAYLISREGARIVLRETPLNDNIDHVFNRLIPTLRAATYLNSVFRHGGGVDSYDTTSEFGSTIMENAVPSAL